MARSADRRVLIVVADGLRPDLFDKTLMPTYATLMRQGTHLTDHHAAYPPHTRVQSSTMATGTAPGRHGIVANVMRVPGATASGIVDTSNWSDLQALDRFSAGHALIVPTLGDILDQRGERLAVAATSSAGAAILWTRKAPYRVVNTNSTYGRADLVSLREKLGELPSAGRAHRLDRLEYAARAVTDLFLADAECRVIVLWMDEPDASQHFSGLGSPETAAALRACDDALRLILDALRRERLDDQFDVFLLSDHGHSTVRHHKSLTEYIERAAAGLPSALVERLTTASDYVYAVDSNPPVAADEFEPLVRWLREQPWTGALFGGNPAIAGLPGVLPLAAVWGGQLGSRAPLLAISPSWTDEVNEFGVPGTVAALTEQVALKATHGAASPFDLHALAAAIGPDFRSGAVSDVPSGAIDLAPTVLAVLGIEHMSSFDGRVWWEAFEHPDGEPGAVREEVVEPTLSSGDGFTPALYLQHVGEATYLDRATNGRA